MNELVADSSVVAKWVMPEADSPQAKQLLASATQSGDRIVVLDLAYAEVANAIWKQFRRKQASFDEAQNSLAALLAIDVDIMNARSFIPDAWEIAARYDVAVYDALFVALTAKSNGPGVTADEPLCKALGKDFPQVKLLREWR